MSVKKILTIIVLSIFILSCSGTAVKKSETATVKSPSRQENAISEKLSDLELLEEALSFLRNDENEPNYNEAKIRLQALIGQFPDSRWVGGAQALITSLGAISALQANLKMERQKTHTEHTKLLKEIDALKANMRQADEKYAAEITKLQQENEQLKNDIQQLKKLEVQLEKREKMLR